MSYATIKLEVADGIALCTFNRPEVRNALSAEMVGEIHTVLRDCANTQVRALIFTGAGDKAFLSGADIAELRERRAVQAFQLINTGLFAAIEALPVPTIAAIGGLCLGGGAELAMACDMRLCSESSRLGFPEVTLGIIPGGGTIYRLPRLVGAGRARELVFTGKLIEAREAERIGLVNRVVPDGQVLDAARALARDIAANGALAVRTAKLTFNAEAQSASGPGMLLEATAQAILFEDEDKLKRMSDFLAKRGKAKRGGA